jgi:hypothetical protein
MGSPVSVAGIVSGVIGIVPGPPMLFGGPPGGATCPGGLSGLNCGGNQPIVGWCASPLGPKAPRVQTLRGGGRPHLTWGARNPPLAAGPPRGTLDGFGPLSPGLYKGRG